MSLILKKYPIVYLVDLFYKILIPAVLGFMGIFVVADAGSRLVHRFAGKGSRK